MSSLVNWLRKPLTHMKEPLGTLFNRDELLRIPVFWLVLQGFELHKQGLIQYILYLAFSVCHIVCETHIQRLHVIIICSGV